MSTLKNFFSLKSEKNQPSTNMPKPAPIHSIHDMQRRSLVGWTSHRLGEFIGLEKERAEALLFQPFIHENLQETIDDESCYLVYLANLLVGWIKDSEDVYMQIKEIKLPPRHHECILQLYEEIKTDILPYLQEGSQPRQLEIHEQHDEIWEVYRDVIFAATQKKLLLILKDEIEQYRQGELLCEAIIRERPDIPVARNLAKDCLTATGISQTQLMNQLLVISEAVTNILKHATEGKMQILKEANCTIAIIEDTGAGIPLKLLPNATLLGGYSTKKSLGQGFTLMMKMADQILLSTSPEGTSIILKFNDKEVDKNAVNG